MKLKLGVLALFVLLMAVLPSAALAQGGGASGWFQEITIPAYRLYEYQVQGWSTLRTTQMWTGTEYIAAYVVQKWVTRANSMLLAPIPAYPLYEGRSRAFCGPGWYYNSYTGGCSRNF